MKCPHCGADVTLVKGEGAKSPSPAADTSALEELMGLVYDEELESAFEQEFMKSLRERFAQYGERTRMSERQMMTLRKIAAK